MSFKLTEDKIVAAIIKRANDGANEGIVTYGDTMDDATKPTVGWIKDTQEELWDAIVYLEKVRQILSEQDL